VYVSGQLAARADGASLADQPFEIQARQALANIIAIVEGAGLGHDRIPKVTAYLVGVEYWPVFNAIYAEVLGEHRPARAVVPVPALHHGYLIELEAIAVR
jgi:enamine deaminase RidA (YjgF/YER057c/UK114 family)